MNTKIILGQSDCGALVLRAPGAGQRIDGLVDIRIEQLQAVHYGHLGPGSGRSAWPSASATRLGAVGRAAV